MACLSATILLALLDRCNPDASNIVAAYGASISTRRGNGVGVPKISTPIPITDWTTERTAMTAITVKNSAVIYLPAKPRARLDICYHGKMVYCCATGLQRNRASSFYSSPLPRSIYLSCRLSVMIRSLLILFPQLHPRGIPCRSGAVYVRVGIKNLTLV